MPHVCERRTCGCVMFEMSRARGGHKRWLLAICMVASCQTPPRVATSPAQMPQPDEPRASQAPEAPAPTTEASAPESVEDPASTMPSIDLKDAFATLPASKPRKRALSAPHAELFSKRRMVFRTSCSSFLGTKQGKATDVKRTSSTVTCKARVKKGRGLRVSQVACQADPSGQDAALTLLTWPEWLNHEALLGYHFSEEGAFTESLSEDDLSGPDVFRWSGPRLTRVEESEQEGDCVHWEVEPCQGNTYGDRGIPHCDRAWCLAVHDCGDWTFGSSAVCFAPGYGVVGGWDYDRWEWGKEQHHHCVAQRIK